MNDAKNIGFDVHEETISAAVRDCAGKLVMDAILETKAERSAVDFHVEGGVSLTASGNRATFRGEPFLQEIKKLRVYWKSLLKRSWLALFPILAVVSFYAAKHTTIELKAFAQVRATPFVLETYSYSFSQNPSGDLLEKRVTARRSDGSTAEVFTMGPHLKLSARTVTFMSGARLNVLDFVSLTKWNMKSSELAALKDRLMNPPPDCLYRPFQLIGHDNLLGEHVVVVEAVYPQQVGRNYLWLAPRLGCESMKFRFETPQPDGSYKLIAESKPVSLRLGEPDPRFFF